MGTVWQDASGTDTTYYFQYGITTNYGSSTPTDSVSSDSTVTAVVNGLDDNTAYHYRLVATNGHGTSYGNDQTFQTASSPQTTAAAPPSASDSGSGGGGGCFIRILASGSSEYVTTDI